MNETNNIVPMVVVKNQNSERSYDIYSRLLEKRFVYLQSPIDNNIAAVTNAQLMHLNNEDNKKPIQLWIMSPGGSIDAGLAIHDVMRYISAPVYTVACGIAASMGAFLLSAGEKRYATPNSRIMIHQPKGGTEGQTTDIKIEADEIVKFRNLLEEYLSKYTGQPKDKVHVDSERNNYMSARESKDYGLVDEVLDIK